MPQGRSIKLEELRAPGIRRVMEAMRMVRGEVSDFDDDEIPKMPAGVLMKGHQDGGGRQRK